MKTREQDKTTWTEKKLANTKTVARLASAIKTMKPGREREKLLQRLGRMKTCSRVLIGSECIPCDRRVIHTVEFCRDRLCPICNWRRSIKSSNALKKIAKDDGQRYIFITLTQKNVEWKKLRIAIGDMLKAWTRLMSWKEVKTITRGYFKTMEITRGKDGLAHPHIHALIAVPTGYFCRSETMYMTQERLTMLWKKALHADYKPRVDIRAVKDINGAINEVTKYITKDCDIEGITDEEYVEYIRAIKGRRIIASGGIFTRAAQEADAQDLLATKDAEDIQVDACEERYICPCCGRVMTPFTDTWDTKLKCYRREEEEDTNGRDRSNDSNPHTG